MMSGTFVITTSAPLTAPRNRPSSSTPMTTSTANSSVWPFISVAATQLVRAICDAIDRSMPPAMTMTA